MAAKKVDVTQDTVTLSDSASSSSSSFSSSDSDNSGSDSDSDSGVDHDAWTNRLNADSDCSISRHFKLALDLRRNDANRISYDNNYRGSGRLVSGTLRIHDGADGRVALFRHVDSFDSFCRWNPDASSPGTENDVWPSLQVESEGEAGRSKNKSLRAKDDESQDEEGATETETQTRAINPYSVGFTNHIDERMWERGFSRSDFYNVIQNGCRVREKRDGRLEIHVQRVTSHH